MRALLPPAATRGIRRSPSNAIASTTARRFLFGDWLPTAST
jgi:hypothetical protein